MSSLAEKISALTNPIPKVFDPEDDVNVETVATIGAFEEDGNEPSFTTSQLRIKTAPLLEDIDPRYTGKKVSRKSLGGIFKDDKTFSKVEDESQHSQSENDDEDEYSDLDEDEMDEDELSDTDLEKFKTSFKSHISSDVEENIDEEKSGEPEGSEEEESDDDDDDADDDDNMVSKFSNIDVSSELEKGQAVKNQHEIFNRLCECRIKLQKILIIANQLPQANCWKILEQKGEDMTECINKSLNSTKGLLNHCLNLETKLIANNLEAHEINDQKQSNDDDEEIPSDTDDEVTETSEKKIPQKVEKKILKRKLNCEEYGDILTKRHKSIIPYRNSVIQKFYEKTKLAYGKVTKNSFSALDISPLQQIEQILQDENRLIKRTQLKRSLYKIIGKPDVPQPKREENSESNENISKQDMLLKDYDPEIFDDDDFYRLLLKDIIYNISVGIDPAVLRKQMEIQSVRNKLKRKVDTKASKGRRLRFNVHAKLVNYMAPIETSTIPDEARNALMKCIFGNKSS